MLTQNEITSLSLSPTKKDFVQIWNELLEVAGKLSERWDPTSTNESDPGIVILKALAGIADKLNYNIDKNTLEAFMPTAAQEDSMRKLCDMLGYNIKYYQSAKTAVTIKYHNSDPSGDEKTLMEKEGLTIPKFAVITNSDQDVSYFIIDEGPEYPAPASITAENPSKTFICMEGQLVKCESINDNNVITVNQISENNRFYLPETYIAENGIFIYNIFNGEEFGATGLADGAKWEKVDNLNVQPRGSRVYKFGFDSYENRPYIEFPEDYSKLFNEGIFIYYARTSGASGNVSAKTLTKFEVPSGKGWDKVSPESFSAENIFAATTGSNIETIKQAYNNFKKTIGTFETLVTCRDYMNKIYSMVDYLGKPYVSNILITDIRNDLNKAVTICSCDNAGIFYKETALTEPVTKVLKKAGTDEDVEVKDDKPLINHFDLVFYPFKSYNQIKNNVKDIRNVYDSSFNYTNSTFREIIAHLENESIQTIAHNPITPNVGDVVCINNYLRLSATIATNSKITIEEGAIIKDKIKIALANAFNMRELDFGEEIPFDSIVEVIENADSRIRLASLNEPDLYTTFSVLDSIDNGTPVLKEYAVESSHLTLSEAITADRFHTDEYEYKDARDTEGNLVLDANGKPVQEPVSLSTFNTKKAREIYNKLAIRNVLAGRVPLFDYNTTFKPSFSEGTYQVTDIINKNNIPSKANLLEPNKDCPFTISTYEDKIYTGQWSRIGKPDNLEVPSKETPELRAESDDIIYIGKYNEESKKAEYSKIVYTETSAPEGYGYENNTITEIVDDKGGNHDITSITTNCKIKAENGIISDVKLDTGEFIKFRAPNFTTVKTYPAYVNYHLALDKDKEALTNAIHAEAESLFDLLNKDKDNWSLDSGNNPVRWQKVLNFFAEKDRVENRSEEQRYRKVASRTKRISAFSAAGAVEGDLCTNPDNTSGQHENDGSGKCKYCGVTMLSKVQNGPIVVTVNEKASDEEQDLVSILNKSGCLKLSDSHEVSYNADTKLYEFKAILEWDDDDNSEIHSKNTPDLDIRISLSSPFITNSLILSRIDDAVATRLEEMVGQVKTDGVTPMLPTEGAWTLTFEYEYVAFEPASLSAWEEFVKTSGLFEFEPVIDSDSVFWRVYGEGYDAGKFILQSSKKLLTFDSNYFGLLQESRLKDIYLVKDLGRDVQPAVIKNGEEYKLRDKEYLYIEYTPSTATEDGTSQDQSSSEASVTEILGPGTIIKPTGFDLMDSSIYDGLGNTYFKRVTFETPNGTREEIEMQHFGANEQVEVRDFAKVELTKNSFKNNPAIYVYKNFNNCPELEDPNSEIRSYTLKDGEYIFYTDQNQTELAYFTTGTEVTLSGKVVLPEFEVINLATVFDTGLSAIPWAYLGFSGDDDKIIFQEYQYITLGPEDTLKSLILMGDEKGNKSHLSKEWQYCDEVVYILAGSNEKTYLSKIDTYADRVEIGKGCGWQACCTLELNVTPNSAQSLRKTDKVETSITLAGPSAIGEGSGEVEIKVPDTATRPIAFKTNLACQTNSDYVNIKDIYSNPKKLKSFELKVFTKEEPVIVKTLPGRIAPADPSITDITVWPGEPLTVDETADLKYAVTLDDIKIKDQDSRDNFDKALKLPVTVLPNTYGVFCFYLYYSSESAKEEAKTWIEVLPGTDTSKISIINSEASEWEDDDLNTNTNSPARLYLKQGINCIRVDKTSKLFVKTSLESQGSLIFDELKLVNCASITYRGQNIKTLGLNIKQLGYLNPEDTVTLEDIAGIDEDFREKLKTSYIEETFAKLDKLSISKEKEKIGTGDDKEKNFSDLKKEIFEVKPKLQKITDIITAAKEELQAIINNITKDDESNKLGAYMKLFDEFRSLSEELAKENSLLTALNENKSLEALEQPFTEMLEKFSSVEDTQQKLLEKLEALKIKALEEAANLDKDTVLSNFDKLDDLDKEKFLPDLKEAYRTEVEKHYNEQLSPLIASIEKVVNSEERASLLAVVNTLKETNSADKQIGILTKVRQLAEAVDKTELDGYLDSVLSAAIDVDYKTLHTALIKLEGYLNSKDFNVIMLEIEQAAAEGNNQHLQEVIETLYDLVSSQHTATETINSIIVQVAELHGEEDEDPDVTASIKSLYNMLSENYENTVTDLLDEIQGFLQELTSTNESYDSIVEKLQESKDSQVRKILEKIDNISNSRSEQIGLLENVSNATLDNLPYKDAAIYAYYSEYLSTQLIVSIEDLYRRMHGAISKLDNASIEVSNLELISDSKLAFEDLSAEISDLINKNSQNKAHIDFIKRLNTALPTSSALTTAMSAFSNLQNTGEANRHTIIRNLITSFTDTNKTMIEKQNALKALKVELNHNISINESIVTALANILCPSILLIEKKLPEAFLSENPDDFYSAWIAEITKVRADLFSKCRSESLTLTKDLLEDYFNSFDLLSTESNIDISLLNALKTDQLEDWLLDMKSFDVSLLSVNYKNKLGYLSSVVHIQKEVQIAKETDFIALLSSAGTLDKWYADNNIKDEAVQDILEELITNLQYLNNLTSISKEDKDAYNHYVAEQKLLNDIHKIDKNRDFYYTAPSNLSLAIELNESKEELNTLMNPHTYYDVNNVNNSFVISKLDIDFLDDGIQLARSSRLN